MRRMRSQSLPGCRHGDITNRQRSDQSGDPAGGHIRSIHDTLEFAMSKCLTSEMLPGEDHDISALMAMIAML